MYLTLFKKRGEEVTYVSVLILMLNSFFLRILAIFHLKSRQVPLLVINSRMCVVRCLMHSALSLTLISYDII